MSMKEKYLEEYEKYKDIELRLGRFMHKTEPVEYEIISIDYENDKAEVKTCKSGLIKTKTLHWCRKYLSI